MAIPKTEEGLKAAGYIFAGSDRCKGCAALIYWYLTPRNKRMPIDPGTFEPHFATCPKAQEFRKAKR